MHPIKIILLITFVLLSGCSGLTKGVVEAFLDREEQEDTRKCWVRGKPFKGLNDYLEEANSKEQPLKILMVHGVGDHTPGYSYELQDSLVHRLGMDQANAQDKVIQLVNLDNLPVGVLQVSRYLSSTDGREFQFYELTWDSIVAEEKAKIYFDNNVRQSFRRAGLNNSFKSFVNDTIPDALMYNSQFRPLIQASVNQAMCIIMSDKWDSIPNAGIHFCDIKKDSFWSLTDSNLAIISHSLGSRIALDSIQRAAEFSQEYKKDNEKLNRIRNSRLAVYMLSNQLPLLQLGQPAPEVINSIDKYCRADSPLQNERMYQDLQLVSISDPNDLFSYSVTQKFVDENIDSRLCPSLTNVVINVASVTEFAGQEFANPLTAHLDYEEDARVLSLLTEGIHKDNRAEESASCDFIETLN